MAFVNVQLFIYNAGQVRGDRLYEGQHVLWNGLVHKIKSAEFEKNNADYIEVLLVEMSPENSAEQKVTLPKSHYWQSLEIGTKDPSVIN